MDERDLRLILTNECNYRCTFCHNEWIRHEILKTLNNEDYIFLYDVVKQKQKIWWVTLTGWEPLRYKNIESLTQALYENWAKITVVTNWSLLHKHLDIGKWVDRINVSLHSLDQNQYKNITQTSTKIGHILSNIELIKQKYPKLNIRLNATIVKWRNDNVEDISSMVEIANKYWLSIKFVELFPNTEPDFIDIKSIEHLLKIIWFKFYEETPRQIKYCKWKIIISLTRIISNYSKSIDENKYTDIFVSPDWLVSPYPYNDWSNSLYDQIKNRDSFWIEKILHEAINEVSAVNL